MRNKATKKNMDLDLRRYGNKLYSKAENSGGSSDSGGGSASPVLDWMFPGLIGFVDTTDNSFPVDTADWENWALTEDIIPVDDIKDYLMAKLVESGESYIDREFSPVLEYNEKYDNQAPSFRSVYMRLNEDSDTPCISGLNDYSYNQKVWKDGTAYLIGLNPGD